MITQSQYNGYNSAVLALIHKIQNSPIIRHIDLPSLMFLQFLDSLIITSKFVKLDYILGVLNSGYIVTFRLEFIQFWLEPFPNMHTMLSPIILLLLIIKTIQAIERMSLLPQNES